MVAVELGVDHVQGTINGYGERTGNADLCTLIPNLSLKKTYETISEDSLSKLTQIANHIAELVNVAIDSRHPYVGSSAFTHKAGLHASGMAKDNVLYEHIDSSKVGNFTRTTVSELAGRASVITKAQEFGLALNNEEAKKLIESVQNLEHEGFQFEAADASLFILMNTIKGVVPNYFSFESFRVFSERRNSENVVSEAVCKISVKDNRYVKTGEGVGPVDALSKALKSALEKDFERINEVKLIDYKVRIIDSSDGTEAKTRVLIEFTDGTKQWSTIGVHENIINASWNALCDGFNYYFMTS
jgi:2-isopropylmalate synthase